MDGWVKVLSVTDNGHEAVLGLRGDGDIVGETSGETDGYRSATVRTIDDVHALIVGYDRFDAVPRQPLRSKSRVPSHAGPALVLHRHHAAAA